MARYKHLPIYKCTYDLLQKVTFYTRNFPRDFKYTLGDKLRGEVIDLVIYVYRANSSADKSIHLSSLQERLLVVDLMLRLSHDLKLLDVKAYSICVELTNNLQKQSNAWAKSQKNQAD
jgi:hypothetical protein